MMPVSKLPVVIQRQCVPRKRKPGAPKIKMNVQHYLIGTTQELAKEATRTMAKLDTSRTLGAKRQRKLTKVTKGNRKYTKEDLLQAVNDLNLAAEKFGAHIVYVDAIRSGKKQRSRIRDKAAVLMHQLRAQGGIAAGKVDACLNVVTQHLGQEAFKENWASERTILRIELIMDQIELILLREHLHKALRTSLCWDLSPQSSKEMMVTLLRVSWKLADLPDIYSRVHEVGSTDRVVAFSFALPLVQCATKDHQDVAEKVREQLQLVGLTPADLTRVAAICVVGDGGSENVPAMKLLFGEDGFERIYCAAHGWNLVFTHACQTIDGRSKKAELKNSHMRHW